MHKDENSDNQNKERNDNLNIGIDPMSGSTFDDGYRFNRSTYVSKEEEEAFEYVQRLKNFYKNVITYFVVIAALTVMNLVTSPGYLWVIWPAMGWGIGIAVQALHVYEVTSLFSPEWERNMVEKRLGRKL